MRSKLIQTALRAAEQIAETQAIKSAPIQNLTHNLMSSNFIPNANHVMNTNFIPVVTTNFIPTTPNINPLTKDIMEGLKREESKKTFLRDFEKYKEEIQRERYPVNNPISFNIHQKNNETKGDLVIDTKQKANDPTPAKKFTSAKAIQDEVFKEAKEHIQDYRPLLVLFNVSEGTLKKTSMPLFEGIYGAFADKDGIPEDKAKAVLQLAKWLILAIIAFALYEYVNKNSTTTD